MQQHGGIQSQPNAGEGVRECGCRLCSYDREFAAHIAFVPAEHRPFFEALKENWEATDADLQSANARLGGDF